MRSSPAPGRARRWLLGAGEPVARLGRDLRRYFPHQAERTIGLARGARVAESALWELLAALDGKPGGGLLLAAGDRPRVARSLPLHVGELLVRRSSPTGGLASLEVTLPGLAPGLAGVNEHGLVATATWCAGPGRDLSPSNSAACRAPGWLLVQECLQRFRAVEAALEWCQRRPAGNDTTVVLADATGAWAAVRVQPDTRHLMELEREKSWLVGVDGSEAASRLAKEVVVRSSVAADPWAALEAAGLAGRGGVELEAGRRAIGLRAPGGSEVEWLEL